MEPSKSVCLLHSILLEAVHLSSELWLSKARLSQKLVTVQTVPDEQRITFQL